MCNTTQRICARFSSCFFFSARDLDIKSRGGRGFEIPLTYLTPPQFCVCSKPGHICPSDCVIISVLKLFLTPLSTICQLYRGGQFHWWRKPEYPEKPPTCRKSLTNFILCLEVLGLTERLFIQLLSATLSTIYRSTVNFLDSITQSFYIFLPPLPQYYFCHCKLLGGGDKNILRV